MYYISYGYLYKHISMDIPIINGHKTDVHRISCAVWDSFAYSRAGFCAWLLFSASSFREAFARITARLRLARDREGC